MLRGLYIAGTGMYVNGRRMDVLSNNVVNADTGGYKADILAHRSFKDMLIEGYNRPGEYAHRSVGSMNTGIYIDDIKIHFSQGALEETGRSEDFALEGEGFFAVETPDGVRYTRAGAFWTNAEGYLLTHEGYYVLGENGPINVGVDDTMAVTKDGVVTVDSEEVARMRVVTFGDLQQLRKQGDNLYINQFDQEEQEASCAILQGFQETSNVDAGRELVQMIEVQRAYELNQRMVRMIDETLQRAVNEIARA